MADARPDTTVIRGHEQASYQGQFRIVSIRAIPNYGARIRVVFDDPEKQGEAVFADMVQWGQDQQVYAALQRVCPPGSILEGSLSYDREGDPALDGDGNPILTQSGNPVVNRRAYPLSKLKVVQKTFTLEEALGIAQAPQAAATAPKVV